jgi:hypothetical protein
MESSKKPESDLREAQYTFQNLESFWIGEDSGSFSDKVLEPAKETIEEFLNGLPDSHGHTADDWISARWDALTNAGHTIKSISRRRRL